MTREEAFELWAPLNGLWSPWAKPVLFSHLPVDSPVGQTAPPFRELSWLVQANHPRAIIVDLPGAESVWAGLELMQHMYRPVPLFNACPGPFPVASDGNPFQPNLGPITLVDVTPILVAIQVGAERLGKCMLTDNALPAFLLDANRRGGGVSPDGGDFDNRSVSFPTDFPSANFLLSHGIAQALLVQQISLQPQPDLAHTLRGWQDAGITIRAVRLDSPAAPVDIIVETPSRFGRMFYRFIERMGLRRHELGGFGGIVQEGGGAG